MKKIAKIILIIALFCGVLFSFNKSVNAEEENTSSSAPTTENEIIEDTQKESELQIWMNENLGWLIGIPTGTLMTAIVEFIVLVKKSKKKDEEINETKQQNSNSKSILNNAKTLLNDTKELTNELTQTVNEALTKINDTDLKVNELVSNLSTQLTNKINASVETLVRVLSLLETRVAHLEDVQEMIALHTKELVANGTAEEITKKIRG